MVFASAPFMTHESCWLGARCVDSWPTSAHMRAIDASSPLHPFPKDGHLAGPQQSDADSTFVSPGGTSVVAPAAQRLVAETIGQALGAPLVEAPSAQQPNAEPIAHMLGAPLVASSTSQQPLAELATQVSIASIVATPSVQQPVGAAMGGAPCSDEDEYVPKRARIDPLHDLSDVEKEETEEGEKVGIPTGEPPPAQTEESTAAPAVADIELEEWPPVPPDLQDSGTGRIQKHKESRPSFCEALCWAWLGVTGPYQ